MKKRYKIRAIARGHYNQFLSSGENSYVKTHPLQAHFATLVNEPKKQYLHAEIATLLKAGIDKVRSLRIINESTMLGDSEPCKVCRKAIQAFGVKKIIYYKDSKLVIEKL